MRSEVHFQHAINIIFRKQRLEGSRKCEAREKQPPMKLEEQPKLNAKHLRATVQTAENDVRVRMHFIYGLK